MLPLEESRRKDVDSSFFTILEDTYNVHVLKNQICDYFNVLKLSYVATNRGEFWETSKLTSSWCLLGNANRLTKW